MKRRAAAPEGLMAQLGLLKANRLKLGTEKQVEVAIKTQLSSGQKIDKEATSWCGGTELWH